MRKREIELPPMPLFEKIKNFFRKMFLVQDSKKLKKNKKNY